MASVPGFEIVDEPPTVRDRVALRIRLFDVWLRVVHGIDISQTRIGRRPVRWAWSKFSRDDHAVVAEHPLLESHNIGDMDG